jgi:hypothetical protein
MAGTAHDLLDRDIISVHVDDHRVGLFAAQVSFILDPFGYGEQCGIDCSRTDRASATCVACGKALAAASA